MSCILHDARIGVKLRRKRNSAGQGAFVPEERRRLCAELEQELGTCLGNVFLG